MAKERERFDIFIGRDRYDRLVQLAFSRQVAARRHVTRSEIIRDLIDREWNQMMSNSRQSIRNV